jgi:hypothetical protein
MSLETNYQDATERHATASIWFLDDIELYKTVKPYRLNFPPEDEDFPRSNFQKKEAPDIPIHDIRNHPEPLSYDRNGFTVIHVESSLTTEDCGDPNVIQELYFTDLVKSLARLLATPHIEILGYQVRIRHKDFPISTGENYKQLQPVLMAHIGS